MKIGMWRIDGGKHRRLGASVLPSVAALENFLEEDPSLLGEPLLVIGRQVRTPHRKFIDLLAMDDDGNLHVLELIGHHPTWWPRDAVAQCLDYGSLGCAPRPGHRYRPSCCGGRALVTGRCG